MTSPPIARVFEILDLHQSTIDNPKFVNHKIKGEWVHYSYSEFCKQVHLLSKGLIASGVKKGDTIAIMAPNSVFWNICDFGIMQTGAYVVPIYPTMSEKDVSFILKDAHIKTIFVADETLYQKIKSTGYQSAIYTFEKCTHLPHWEEIKQLGEAQPEINLEALKSEIKSDDTFTLIYTSGTTGTPKGVMLTHSNMVCNTYYATPIFPPGITKALSFLPISHVFERMVLYIYFFKGISVYYAESLETLVANIQEVQPESFACVPRLLEKVYKSILAKGKELTGVKKKLFFWALSLANDYEFEKTNFWYQLQLKIARKLIFSKWQAALGGNIKGIILGGAALNPKLARIFWAADLRIYEGYGLTETSPVITVNHTKKVKFGSVGTTLEGVEVQIAQDGEILARGHNIMKGYYNRDDLTREVIDADGWFHTGDIGEFTPDGFLRITDRKKEMFKTAGGKYVAPQLIENKIKESALVEQVMVLGENRKFPSALIVPNFEALEKWCTDNEISYKGRENTLKNPAVIQKFDNEVHQLNANFGRWEQVKKIILLPQEWTIDNGEITPKLSLKRKVILANHMEKIEKLYQEDY